MRRTVVAFLIVVAALALYFFASEPPFSTYSTTYECSGVMTNTSDPVTLFIKIRQEGWWVLRPHHWEGLALEIPSTTAPTRTDIFKMKGDNWFLNFYRYPVGGETADLTKLRVGQFSTISNFLTLKISDDEIFRGRCTPKNN
jgi:hypothetical protein